PSSHISWRRCSPPLRTDGRILRLRQQSHLLRPRRLRRDAPFAATFHLEPSVETPRRLLGHDRAPPRASSGGPDQLPRSGGDSARNAAQERHLTPLLAP